MIRMDAEVQIISKNVGSVNHLNHYLYIRPGPPGPGQGLKAHRFGNRM